MKQAREHQVQEQEKEILLNKKQTNKKPPLFSMFSTSLKCQAAGQFSAFENKATF